ncbi:MAG: biotin/lipoyl-binding protein [Planctomycetes bacterium]|nr:biotin/lipoyl-binding protein [Planctomycetota bacterium]
MKKWILLFIVVAAVVGTWYFLRTNYRYTPSWDQPEFDKITRGNICVPITAAGLIEPAQRIEVKSKASGEVIKIHVVEGRFVKEGDPLLELKPDDERRTRDRAQDELARAQAMLATARVAEKKAGAGILTAEARIKELAAQASMTAYELHKIEEYREENIEYSQQQLVDARARHEMILAQQQAASAARDNAHSGLEEAKQSVRLQEAAVRIATTALADANERLAETTVLAKHSAIVTEVLVEKGMLIQSGTMSLMGGTPVMYLADVSKKKVVARVDEADYGRVTAIAPLESLPEMPGQDRVAEQEAEGLAARSGVVKLTFDAFPDLEFEGKIERVEPQGRLNAGSSVIQFNVHVVITDEKAHMLPLGTQAQVEFTVESAENVLRVPAEAVMTFQDQRGIWFKTPPEPGSNKAYGQKFVPCRFGITDGEFTEVIAAQGGDKLQEQQVIFTKLPPERENR